MPPVSKSFNVAQANSYGQAVFTSAKLLTPIVVKTAAKSAPDKISIVANTIDLGVNLYDGNYGGAVKAGLSTGVDAATMLGKYVPGAAPVAYGLQAYNAGCYTEGGLEWYDLDCIRYNASAVASGVLTVVPGGQALIPGLAAANDVADVGSASVTIYNDYQKQRQAANSKPSAPSRPQSVVASNDLGRYYADRDGDTKPSVPPAPRRTKTIYTATAQPVVVTAKAPTYDGGTLAEVEITAKNESPAIVPKPIPLVRSMTMPDPHKPVMANQPGADDKPPVVMVDESPAIIEAPSDIASTGVAAIMQSEGLATDNTTVTPDRELVVSPEPTITETSTDNAVGINAILETQAPIVSSEDAVAVSEPELSVLADPVITLPSLDEPVETAPLIADAPVVIEESPPSLLDFAGDCLDCPPEDEVALDEAFADVA